MITAPRAVAVDVPVRIGRLDFENANAYTLAGTNAVTLDATSGDAQINVTLGQHAINAPVTLADNTTIKIAPQASRLTLGGTLNAIGKRLTKTGAGTLALNPLDAAELSIEGGSVAVSTQSTSDATVIGTLSISGGATPTATLDLTNSAAVIDYTGASPAATVRVFRFCPAVEVPVLVKVGTV